MAESVPLQFAPTLTDEDRARADYYALLARLYFDGPDAKLLAAIGGAVPIVAQDGAQGAALAAGWAQLQAACRCADAQTLSFEYSNVFIGTGKALVTLYSTHYLEESMKGRALVRLRERLRELGLARTGDAGVYEDHIASLCEVMRHLVLEGSGVAAMQQQKEFFISYIQPCYQPFSSSVEACTELVFYKAVGRFSKAFFDIEAEALSMV